MSRPDVRRSESDCEIDVGFPVDFRKKIKASAASGCDWVVYQCNKYTKDISYGDYTFKFRLNLPSKFFVNNHKRVIKLLAGTNRAFGHPIHSFICLTTRGWLKLESCGAADFHDYGQVTCYLAEDFDLAKVAAFFQHLQHELIHSLGMPEGNPGMMPYDTAVAGCANVSFRLECVNGEYIDLRKSADDAILMEAFKAFSMATPGNAKLSGDAIQVLDDNIHALMLQSLKLMLHANPDAQYMGIWWFELTKILNLYVGDELLITEQSVSCHMLEDSPLAKYQILFDLVIKLCAKYPACGYDSEFLRRVKCALDGPLLPHFRLEIEQLLLAIVEDNAMPSSKSVNPLLAWMSLKLYRLVVLPEPETQAAIDSFLPLIMHGRSR
ncbi:MAG: hypothetical protein P1U40_06135 [Coxiellaceae bacterium]|nr:hypothetical protein [Coxiellaceae bacterium]